jgi:hypothetical protein
MRPSRHALPLASLTLFALSGIAFAASTASCSSSGGNTSVPDSGPVASATFQPQGCGYTVGAVENFPSLDPHAAAGAGAPKKVRLGLGGNVAVGTASYADPSKTFAVVWQTDEATTATQIKWGDSATALSNGANGVSYVVAAEFGSPSADGDRYHEAHVCGLQPGRTYYYQVGGGAAGQEQWSAVFTVTTAPASSAADPVLIGVAGDTRDAAGTSKLPVWQAITGRLKNAGAHVALFSGDFVFAGADQQLWDVWTGAAEAAASSVFLAMAPGNHDNETLSYFAHALMPGAVGKNYERYSSFDYGPVHVVSYDDQIGIIDPSSDDSGYRAEVLAWLDADLTKADANRANVPWIVAFHHHPLFSSTTQADRAPERKLVRDAVQATYDKHHLDMDFAGHDHFFERSKPMVGDTPVAAGMTGGTTYVISAGGGAPAYSTTPGQPQSAKIQQYSDATEGLYGIVSATKTSFTLKTYKLVVGTGTGPADDTVVDTFTLTK